MNQLAHPHPASDGPLTSPASAVLPDVVEARFALRIAAALTERSAEIDVDVAERLRFAREQALERARGRRAAIATGTPVVGVTRGGAAILGSIGTQWWVRLASAMPVLALVAGLIAIDRWQDDVQISAAAEVDLPLLSDDLPPTAYSDAGFAEFLKTPSE